MTDAVISGAADGALLDPAPAVTRDATPKAGAASAARGEDMVMIRKAAELTRDLNTPSKLIYWGDFLASAFVGYATMLGAILATSWPLASIPIRSARRPDRSGISGRHQMSLRANNRPIPRATPRAARASASAGQSAGSRIGSIGAADISAVLEHNMNFASGSRCPVR